MEHEALLEAHGLARGPAVDEHRMGRGQGGQHRLVRGLDRRGHRAVVERGQPPRGRHVAPRGGPPAHVEHRDAARVQIGGEALQAHVDDARAVAEQGARPVVVRSRARSRPEQGGDHRVAARDGRRGPGGLRVRR